MLPNHGKLTCTNCFANQSAVWGKTATETDGWRLEYAPGAWGSANPKTLVLGFSKGANQMQKLATRAFDDIPFSGMRPNMTRILHRLGLLSLHEAIDSRIKSDEQDYAFGSLIRCSVSAKNPVTGKFEKSGDVIRKSCTASAPLDFIGNCTRQFLANLPPRLETVVMLSNDDDYVDACYEQMRKLHPDLKRINAVAYGNKQVTFVHVIHPAGTSGRHIPDWLEATKGKQALKRDMAIAALSANHQFIV